jgi:threonylcarbamoyladenosine tRNA methylthiotransferase MtaB
VKVFLDSIGCRLNQSEIEAYALQFRSAGHSIVGSAAEADWVIVNTCAVTAEAASDSRQKARQAARQLSAGGKIILTGCWSTLEPQAAAMLPRVERVVPNLSKDQLTLELLSALDQNFDLEPVAREPLPGLHRRTRAFLKVQDGCDNTCTFCVTRIARGPGRSRPVETVLPDVQAAVNGETREIVLSGVHLGSWGQDMTPPIRLQDLVAAVLDAGGFERLRLSSLEPWDLDDGFFDLFSDRRLCRHLHLPLQSGCAATLRRMARKTNPDEFRRLMDVIRGRMPDAAITTDVIVGFPGETEREFEESLEFVRAMRFSGGHVFSYSARPGTAAVRLPGQVAGPLRKERSEQMRAAFNQAAGEYQAQFLNRIVSVLWESADRLGPDGWRLHGLSDNFLKVTVTSPAQLWNQISPVRLLRAENDRVEGEIVLA